jgi:ABC-type multidrug transport system fused ATPase/permease subunit
MEHSRAEGRLGLSAALMVLDLTGRLALPAALLALAHGASDQAAIAAATATAATSARGFVLGRAVERALTGAWRRLVDASLALPAEGAPRAGRQHEALRLVSAVRESAMFEAQLVPSVIAHALALLALALAVAVALGPLWLALGAVGALAVGALVAGGQLRLRAASARAWSRFEGVARDTLVLLEAGALLTAHGRARAASDDLLRGVGAMARAERTASTWSASLGLLPAALAVLAAAASSRAERLVAWVGTGSLVDASILGGSAVMVALSLARALESAMRGAPQRRTLEAFWRRAAERARADETSPGGVPPPPLADALVELERASCLYPGASAPTPDRLSFRWQAARGLAVQGENGSGKSTLALMLVGLVAPTSGRIMVAGAPLDALDRVAYRARLVYVPQSPFVYPAGSVAWHLRLFARDAPSDARIDAAIAQVGLLRALEEHGARAGLAPRDVPAGELSGGERQRMHLARTLVEDGELVILDEPEAALDEPGRALLRELLERLAERAKVLVIAHDDSVVPASFERVVCRRGLLGPT